MIKYHHVVITGLGHYVAAHCLECSGAVFRKLIDEPRSGLPDNLPAVLELVIDDGHERESVRQFVDLHEAKNHETGDRCSGQKIAIQFRPTFAESPTELGQRIREMILGIKRA